MQNIIDQKTVNSLIQLSKKHCQNIQKEIEEYQIKETNANDLEEKWKNELYDYNTFYRLLELYKSNEEWPFGSGNDTKIKDLIMKKLIQFKNKIQNNTKPFEALQINFTKYFTKESQEIEWQE